MLNIRMGSDTGGKAAIERLLAAYGFTTKQALSEHLNVSKSTMANRVLRDSFPADWIIQCALETGVSLLWLATGQGSMKAGSETEKRSHNENKQAIKPLSKLITPSIPKGTLENGQLSIDEEIFLDHSILPADYEELMFLETPTNCYLIDKSIKQVSNGFWLINIDGMIIIAKIMRIPGNKIVVNQDEASFECSTDDVEVIGRAVKVIKSI